MKIIDYNNKNVLDQVQGWLGYPYMLYYSYWPKKGKNMTQESIPMLFTK